MTVDPDGRIVTACPLDCWDSCSILARVRGNRAIALTGNPQNHVTGRTLCSKGLRHIERMNHRDRLRQPLVKVSGQWKSASWSAALDLVADKMQAIKASGPTTALLNCNHAGNTGLLKKVEERFFNAYGGVTVPTGSLCAGAGAQAQKYDFGHTHSHEVSDVVNSRIVLIWGKNPQATGLHSLPFLKEAQKRGAYIVVIDPIKSPTAKLADLHVAPLPGSDGALALALANVLIQRGLTDEGFIGNYTLGFEAFKAYASNFTLELGAKLSGVPAETIEKLARIYGTVKPAAIYIGYGVQRYSNGGYTVRAIDALGAITGNIGMPGGGVNYSNQRMDQLVDVELLCGQKLKKHHRTFPRPRMASFLENASDPPIKMIFTARANPITQNMDSQRMLRAFAKVDFKVVIDLFITDTAQASDVVLPCRHFLEEENVICPPGSHNYIQYCSQVVEPDPWLPSDLWIYNSLAKRLELQNFPLWEADQWLEKILKPMTVTTGITLAQLKKGPVNLAPNSIPWQERVFATPSGKYELYSERAQEDGFNPLPVYEAIRVAPSTEYPLYLLTPHRAGSLHSQHFTECPEIPEVSVHSATAEAISLRNGDLVEISTPTGSLRCMVVIDDMVGEAVAMIHQGSWLSHGGGVNQLIPERVSEMGCHAAYYECCCNLEKLPGRS